jgi:hypothetical protein
LPPGKKPRHSIEPVIVESQVEDDEEEGGKAKKGRTEADRQAQKLVELWYALFCLVTGQHEAEGSHIFPISVRSHPDAAKYWMSMTYLFGTDKVIMWRKRLFPEGTANYEAG